MKYETELWPFIPARDFKDIPANQPRTVELIVLHTAEAHENPDSAEALGRYFQHPDYVSSSHIGTDSDTTVQYVKDSDVAYAAPGCNHNGIQIEMAGKASQSWSQWWDANSMHILMETADACAQYCLKYDIPAKHLTNAQLKAGEKGIIGHYQASEVYKKSDHSDPGPNFPWTAFIALVQVAISMRRQTI